MYVVNNIWFYILWNQHFRLSELLFYLLYMLVTLPFRADPILGSLMLIHWS